MTLPTTHTLAEVAASLRVHPRTLRRAIARTDLPVTRVGAGVRLTDLGRSRTMKEVTKEEFYRIIFDRKLDVHPTITASGSNFEFKNRALFGKTVGNNGHYWDAQHKYFLAV